VLYYRCRLDYNYRRDYCAVSAHVLNERDKLAIVSVWDEDLAPVFAVDVLVCSDSNPTASLIYVV
jgi:hypothetical protein